MHRTDVGITPFTLGGKIFDPPPAFSPALLPCDRLEASKNCM